jgi:hypothetical protein
MGSWELLEESSEVAPVHAGLLPNGEVVYDSGNTGQDIPAATRIWNPSTHGVREPPNPPATDVFCSGLTPLWDGRCSLSAGRCCIRPIPIRSSAAKPPTSSSPKADGSASTI